MNGLVRDYLALPDIVFAREHWLALLVYMLVCVAVMVISSRSGRGSHR